VSIVERHEWDPTVAPSIAVWSNRIHLYRSMLSAAQGGRVFAAHGQTFALEQDMQRAFLVGAWSATIIIAHAVIEVDLSDRRLLKKADAARLLEARGIGSEVEWLRERRRHIAHLNPHSPGTDLAFTRDEYDAMASDAQRAVRAALSVLTADRS
jgi:hypothetical protein